MNKILGSKERCIMINADCVSMVQVIDGNILKVTLHTGEQMNIPASAFGLKAQFERIPKLVPVTGMFAMFEIDGEVRGCHVHMLSMMENGLQPMSIVLGELVCLNDVPGFLGISLDPNREFISFDEAGL